MRRWLILALAGLMGLQASAEAPQIQVTAVHGQAEARTPGGAWQKLHAPQSLPYGSAIRTENGTADADMAGTHVHLGPSSAFRAIDADNVELVGQAHVDAQSSRVACNIPIGRFQLNGGQGMRPEERVAANVPVATGGESVDVVTPTARDGQLAVLHGSATAQEAHHVSGHVSGVNDHSFTLVDDKGATLMTILLDPHSVMAQRTLGLAREAHGQGILGRLTMEQHLLVYGTPQGNNQVLASVIYPDDGVVVDYDEWFNAPSPSMDGPEVATTSGHTLKLSAGVLLPLIATGVGLTSLAVAQVGAASVLSTGAIVVAGAAVATGAVVANNNNKTTTPPPTVVAVQTTRGIILVLSHPARRALPAIATSPAAPAGTAAAWTPGASLTMQAIGGQPVLAAQLPLGDVWRLRATASASGGVGLTGLQTDVGLDRRVTRFSAIGMGWQHSTAEVVDPLGNFGSLTQDTVQVRYTVHF